MKNRNDKVQAQTDLWVTKWATTRGILHVPQAKWHPYDGGSGISYAAIDLRSMNSDLIRMDTDAFTTLDAALANFHKKMGRRVASLQKAIKNAQKMMAEPPVSGMPNLERDPEGEFP